MRPVFYEPASPDMSQSVYFSVGGICDHPFPPHLHDVVEIVCPWSGHLMMTVGGVRQEVCPGDIAVAFPSVPHSYDEVSPDIDGIALIFSPNAVMEFSHCFRVMLPVCPFLRDKDRAADLTPILRKMKEIGGAENSPLCYGYLHLMLAYLFSCLPLQPMTHTSDSAIAYQAIRYISEHFAEPLSLESTAHALGISRIHLSHVFSQQLRVNFRQYVNTLRIDYACTLLRDPTRSISEIAFRCGYANSRTFHRAFRSQCRMTPCAYREQLSDGRLFPISKTVPTDAPAAENADE